MDQKLWYIYTMEYYTEKGRRELLSFATAWMELENIMLNDKPVSERQVPRDFTYKRNLMNKIN